MLLDDSEAPKIAKINHKALHAYLYEGQLLVAENETRDGRQAEWFCRLDDDAYFSPTNFRHLVAYKKWTADAEIFAGSRSFGLKHSYRPLIFNFASAICLSRAALLALAKRLATAEYNVDRIHLAEDESAVSDFSHDLCHFGQEHDDVMLAACLREVGILPAHTEDVYGRATFLPVEVEDVDRFGPPRSPACEPSLRNLDFISKVHGVNDSNDIVVRRYFYWRHRIHLYARCFEGDWASPYPVSFHMHSKNWSKGYALHKALISGECPSCGSYTPRNFMC